MSLRIKYKTISKRWCGKTFKESKRHAGHCWRSRDELISHVLLWTPSHGRAKAGRPARTYVQQLCTDMGCSPEDLPEATENRKARQKRVRYICADGLTWWWWWKKTGELGKKRTSGYHPHHSIIEIGQTTEKSPGDLLRLGITQTSVKNHQLTLVWKNSQKRNIIIGVKLKVSKNTSNTCTL